ncbi:MAG: hypothetical protein ACJ762_18700 [Solirubrobacteraceae bacterium]
MTDHVGVHDAKRTLEMGVANTGFLIDRIGKDCAPLQFLREITQNSIEAILETGQGGEVVWDVDWNHFELTGVYKLACIDNGIGMTGPEMLTYINHLSSSTHEQSYDGNFGVGAKVAAATRNHAGLVYLSYKDGQGWMTHLWRDPDTGQYGVQRTQMKDGSYQDYAKISDPSVQPPSIDEHGTMVVLFGNDIEDDTMTAPPAAAAPSIWIARYLNTRYFRFPKGITVKAREGWKEPRTNKDVNLLRTVIGQEAYLEKNSDTSGNVRLSNATAHWWILKDGPAISQNSGRLASSGHMAALYQDELYEMVTGRAGVARLQMFGVIFGHNRVVMYVEPDADAGALTSNAARTNLILHGESLPWAEWAAEFRAVMPEEIKHLMEEVTAGSTSQDHKQAIKERLKAIRDLMRVSRYRPTKTGDMNVSHQTAGGKPRTNDESTTPSGSGGGSTGGRAGGIYALFVDDEGVPGEEVFADTDPVVQWISVKDKTRTVELLEDRAAKYLADQNILQINADFRVFNDMIDRWCVHYPDVPGAADVVGSTVREWFEQALVETVIGAQSLQGSPFWTIEDIGKLWSEESLTAAVLQRYHIDINVKRTVGSKLGSASPKVPAAA